MQPKLKPIENPDSLVMKIAYWFTKKKYGKVLTPLKVINARLPIGFSMWVNKIQSLEKQLKVPADLALLVTTHVSQLNTCNFCIDIGKAIAMEKFKQTEKFFQVASYQTSPLFSEKERLALAFAEEMTLHKKVPDSIFAQMKLHFSEREIVEIAWLVTAEHVYNLMNRAFDIESDGLCALKQPLQKSSGKPAFKEKENA